MGDPVWIAAAPSASETGAVWIAAFGTLISATSLILWLGLRWWDSRSHIKIEHPLGDDPPRAWWVEAGSPRPAKPEPEMWLWVENVGTRGESLSDAYITVPGGGDIHPFGVGVGDPPPRPELLQPGFPRVFRVSLQNVSRALVNEGCRGTASVNLVVRLNRGALHKESITMPEVEAKAKDRGGHA